MMAELFPGPELYTFGHKNERRGLYKWNKETEVFGSVGQMTKISVITNATVIE